VYSKINAGIRVGQRVDLECDNGYDLVGPPIMSCNADGTFDYSRDSKCVLQGPCGPIPKIVGGYPTTHGAEIIFHCLNPAQTLSHPGSIYCDLDERRWSSPEDLVCVLAAAPKNISSRTSTTEYEDFRSGCCMLFIIGAVILLCYCCKPNNRY